MTLKRFGADDDVVVFDVSDVKYCEVYPSTTTNNTGIRVEFHNADTIILNRDIDRKSFDDVYKWIMSLNDRE